MTVLSLYLFLGYVVLVSCLEVQDLERDVVSPRLRYPCFLTGRGLSGDGCGLGCKDSWDSPEALDLCGSYAVTYSSRESYLGLNNMRGEDYPVYPQNERFPIGSRFDVTSWSSALNNESNAITTVFGWFVPVADLSFVWRYESTGPLINTTNIFAPLGFGIDSNGSGYRVDYETGYYAEGTNPSNGKPCLNIVSRVEDGPSEVTLRTIVEGLRKLGTRYGDDEFVELAGGLKKMKHDGRRRGERFVVCDERCMQNADLVPV